VTTAAIKKPVKIDQTASKPAGQSSVFVFKGSQTAPAANGQMATSQPAGMRDVLSYSW